MSDYDDNDLDEGTDDTTDQAPPKKDPQWRRRLEAEAEEGRTAKVEAEQARRELAFLKAGIDVDTPQGKLFARAYDGAATVEAVKAEAIELGVIAADTPQVPADELAGHDRIANAAGGATAQSDEQAYLASLNSAESVNDVMEALMKIDPSLVDHSAITGWARPEHQSVQPL